MVKYKNFGDHASTSDTTSNKNGNGSSPDNSSTENAAEILSFTGSTKTAIARGSAGGGGGQGVTSPIPIPFDESKEQQQQQQGEKNSIQVVDSRCDDNDDGNQDHAYSHDHDDDRQEYPASAASSSCFRDEASNSLREEFIEAESESLYDTTTITYHGGTVLSGEDAQSISVCPSSYYGGDSVEDCFSDSYMDTDSMSAGTGLSSMFGTTNESMTLSPCTVSSRSQRGHSPNTRRSKKLSYIGYNPVSPTTAARNIFNSCSNKNMINNDTTTNLNNDTTHNNDSTNTNSNITAVANVIAAAAAINNNNNNSAATTTGVATTCNTGTSSGTGNGEGEECCEEEFYSTISPANTAVTTISATIAEYISPGQQRVLEEEEQQQQHCWSHRAVAQQQQQLQQRQPPSLLLSTKEQHEAIADLGRQRFFLQQQQHKKEDTTNRTNTSSSTALSGDGDSDGDSDGNGDGNGDGDGDASANDNANANGGSDSIPATTTTTTTASSVTSSVVPNVNKNSIFSNIMMYPSRSNNLQECHHQQQPLPSTSIVSPPTIRRLIPINNNHNHNNKDGVVQNNDSTNNNDMIDCGISPVCTDVTSVTEPLQPLPHQHHQLMPPLLNHVAQPPPPRPPPRPPPPLPASTMMMIQQQQQHNLLYQQQQQQVYGYYGNNQQCPQYQQITNGIHNNSNSNSQHQHQLPLPPHPQQYSMTQSTTNNSSSSQRGGAALPFSPTDIGGAAAYPRTPALAEQLHAFHKYHHQDQHQHQHQHQNQSQHQSQQQSQHQLYDVGVDVGVGVGVGVGIGPTVVGATNIALAFMKGSSSTENNNRTTENNDTNTIDGPEGPKLSNVKFVTPNSVSGSSTQRTTNVGGGGDGSYGGGGGVSCSTNNTEFGGVLCAQYPAGKKCEALFTNFFNTCSAIVNHGYADGTQQTITTDQHGNTKKKSSSTKKKRSELEKIADQSLAELAPLPPSPSPPPPPPENLKDNTNKDNNNNDDDVDDKMIDDSFLTSAAYTYQNVYDTFQKYYEPEEATLCEEDAVIESSNTGEREGGVEGLVRNSENERSTVVVASAAAQVTTTEATMIGSPVVFMSADNSGAVVYREISGGDPNEVGEEIDHFQLYQQQHGQQLNNIDTTAATTPVDTTTDDDDVLHIEDDKSAVAEAETTKSTPNKKVEMFKKLRQRRRRKRNDDSDSQSPIRRTSSAPHTSSPISSVASYSKSVEGSTEKTAVLESSTNNANTAAEWQQRYRLNIHTRTMLINNEIKDPDQDQQQDDPTRKYGVQQFSTSEENEEKTNGSSDNNDTIKKKEESEEGDGVARVDTVERQTQPTTLQQRSSFSMYTDIREDQESRCNNNANGEEHPTDLFDIMSMQTCTYSWATPPEEEEESLKGSMDEHEEFSSVQQQSINTPSVIDDKEEVEGGEVTEEVLPSTSSSMSESLVGSDMDDDEQQPLDCISFNSMEELEKDEINNCHGVEYDDNQDQDQDDEDDDTENGLLEESFDNNEFPHTQLEVILEGSREEMTEEHKRTLAFFNNSNTVDDTVLTTTDSGDFSIDECLSSNNDFEEEVHEKNNRDVRSEEASRLEGVEPFSEERIRSGIRFSIYGFLKVVFTLALMLQCCIVIDKWDHVADHVKSIAGGPYVIATLEDIALSLKSKGSSWSGSFLAAPAPNNDLIKLEPTHQEGIVKKHDEEEEELSQEGDQSVAKDFIQLESAEDFVKFIEEELSQVDDHRRDDIHKSEDNSVAPEDPRKVTSIATEPPSDNDDELRVFQQLVEEALVPIDNEIQVETVVQAVVPPSIVMEDTTTEPKSDWVQELEDSLEV